MGNPSREPNGAVERARWPLLVVCFLLSGAAGLIYQTAWVQELTLVFGASEMAVAAVLAAYMGGLTAGALAAGRWLRRERRRLLATYVILELAIALGALAVPFALVLAARVRSALFAGPDLQATSGPGSAVFYLAATFLVLLLPTASMGATLPVLTRWAVREDGQIGPRTARLYAANTAGAAAGVLLTAFWLLPAWGLGNAVWAAVGLNLLVALLVLPLARSAGDRSTSPSTPPATGPPTVEREARSRHRWVLPAIAASGFVAFGWEIAWTRLLTHLLGGSIYAFGLMLATFLVGIAGGSMIAAPWTGSERRARIGFVGAQLGVGVASWAAFLALDPIAASLTVGAGRTSSSMLLAAVTLLPGALMMGAAFPCAVRLAAPRAEAAGTASARVYAWNTAGAILGAVGVGFVLLPKLRFTGMATCLIAGSFLLAAVAAGARKPRFTASGAVALGAVLAVLVARPPTPWRTLRTAAISGNVATGAIEHYGVGRSATVLVYRQGPSARLTTNGLPESLVEPPGARAVRTATAGWLGLLPVAVRPSAKSALVVGLGAGITANSIPPSVEEVHVVELEPEVVAANAAMAGRRRRDPLADPRIQVHLDDARSALALTTRSFDVIVSQPSHPWTAGASHLFTREFFELARDRLSERGVFVQWIGLRFVDEPLTRSLVATLLEVFPHLEVYRPAPGGALLFVASRTPLDVEASAPRAFELAPDLWPAIGVATPEEIWLARMLDSEGSRALAAGSELTTDRRNLLQVRSPAALRAAEPTTAHALLADHDVLRRRMALPEAVSIVRQLLEARQAERAQHLAAAIPGHRERRAADGLLFLGRGQPRRGEAALRQALRASGESGCSDEVAREALAALLRLRQQALAAGQATGLLERAGDCDRHFLAVVEGWRQTALRNPGRVRALDDDLAAVPPSHPLHLAATNLRVGWRARTNRADRYREALALYEPLIPARPRVAAPLIQRAALATGAGDLGRLEDTIAELIVLANQGAPLRQARRRISNVATDRGLSADERAAALAPLEAALEKLASAASR